MVFQEGKGKPYQQKFFLLNPSVDSSKSTAVSDKTTSFADNKNKATFQRRDAKLLDKGLKPPRYEKDSPTYTTKLGAFLNNKKKGDLKKSNNNTITKIDHNFEEYDAFDIVLGYLQESGQVDSIDEALYIMMEMDAATIQSIVKDFELLAEEAADKVKDDRLVNYGIGHDGSDKKAGSKRRSGGKRPKGKTPLQKETEKKYGKGKTAVEIVRKKIEDEHGKGAIA